MKKQSYFLVRFILPLFIFSALVVFVIGCNSNPLTTTGTTSKTKKTITESEFKSNPNMKAEWGDLIVLNLEDLHSPVNDTIPDIDLIGEDMVPVIFIDTLIQQFNMEDSSNYKVKLVKESGETVFELTPENNQADVTILPGNYKLYVTSLKEFDSEHPTGQVIFIQPYTNTEETGGGKDNSAFITPEFRYSCPRCDLSNKSFVGMAFRREVPGTFDYIRLDFSEANFSNSNLKHTDIVGCNFTKAILINTQLQGSFCNKANFTNANLSYANFNPIIGTNGHIYYSKLVNAKLTHAVLIGTSFYMADLAFANLQYANLSDANLRKSNLISTDLRYANITNTSFCGASKTGVQGPPFAQSGTQCWP